MLMQFLLIQWILLTVPFRHGERIGFSYLISQKYTGDNAEIKILRESVTHKFNIKLGTHRRLIPAHSKGRPPSYYIVAGFVFSTVSVPYLRSEVCPSYVFSNCALMFGLSVMVMLINIWIFIDLKQEKRDRAQGWVMGNGLMLIVVKKTVSRTYKEKGEPRNWANII